MLRYFDQLDDAVVSRQFNPDCWCMHYHWIWLFHCLIFTHTNMLSNHEYNKSKQKNQNQPHKTPSLTPVWGVCIQNLQRLNSIFLSSNLTSCSCLKTVLIRLSKLAIPGYLFLIVKHDHQNRHGYRLGT